MEQINSPKSLRKKMNLILELFFCLYPNLRIFYLEKIDLQIKKI